MDHADHLNLLRNGIVGTGGTWADFGAGRGAFTLALADLLGPAAILYAVDRDRVALQTLHDAMRDRFAATRLEIVAADFTAPLDLPPLDGIVIANALHFQRDCLAVARTLRQYLAPGGSIIVVEYNIDQSNFAVPHPVPFRRWEQTAHDAGFRVTRLIATRPSSTLHEIYAAASS